MTDRLPLVDMRTFSVPERSDWECDIVSGFTLRPDRGDEPNAFHRLMQRLAFGFRWRKWREG